MAFEIRKLSDESQAAMEGIRDLIGQIQAAFHETLAETEAGSQFVRDSRSGMERTGGSIVDMLKAMEKTIASMEEISHSTMDQTDVFEDLSKAMGMVNVEMEKTMRAADTTLHAVNRLRGQAEILEKLASVYKV